MTTKLSYASAPLAEPYIYQSVPDRLRDLADEQPDTDAFVCYDAAGQRRAISRAQLHKESILLARSLVDRGLKKGSHVAVCMNNSMNALICNMAVTCADGIIFYISTKLADGSDIIDAMNQFQCDLFIIDTNGDDENWRVLGNIWPIGWPQSSKVPTLRAIICNGEGNSAGQCDVSGRISLRCLMESNANEYTELPMVDPKDVLMYLCTSGSSGQPKEIQITHFGIINWTKQSNKVFHITNNSRFFNDRTFSWVFGYPRTYITEGATRVFVDPKITSASGKIHIICDIIEKEKCDVVYLPGYIVADLQKSDVDLFSKFRYVDTVIQGGERIPTTRVEFLKDRFCKRVLIYYGTTESGGNSSFANDDLSQYEDGIIGLPLDGCEIKVVDDQSNTVPMGTSGEICVRSNWRFTGYRTMPRKKSHLILQTAKSHRKRLFEKGTSQRVLSPFKSPIKKFRKVQKPSPLKDLSDFFTSPKKTKTASRGMDAMFRQTVDNNNWFYTKDMGHMRPDGNFVVDGRRLEIITIQTNKYYPWVIEQQLKQFPDAEQAFAVGVPDERMGQVFCACILPKTGKSVAPDDVKQFCDERFLKTGTGITTGVKPAYYLIFKAIPMLSSGKFDRKKLTTIAKEKLGL